MMEGCLCEQIFEWSETMTTQNTGKLLHATLLGGSARALIAHTTSPAQAAREMHDLSPTATAALGRLLTGTAMLASMLKGDGDSISVSINGGGPLGAALCVGKPDGSVKGYVDHPDCDPPRRSAGKLDVGGAVGSDGFLTVVRDLGFGEPYIGRTPLVSGEVAEDIAHYLLHSEQTPSLVALGVLTHPERVLGAGGILIQTMPGCTEEDIVRLEALAPVLSSISRLAAENDTVEALARACLEDIEHEFLEITPIIFACDCGRERMEQVMLSLGEEELRDMLAKERGSEISCHFCGTKYRFTEEEILALIQQAKE